MASYRITGVSAVLSARAAAACMRWHFINNFSAYRRCGSYFSHHLFKKWENCTIGVWHIPCSSYASSLTSSTFTTCQFVHLSRLINPQRIVQRSIIIQVNRTASPFCLEPDEPKLYLPCSKPLYMEHLPGHTIKNWLTKTVGLWPTQKYEKNINKPEANIFHDL